MASASPNTSRSQPFACDCGVRNRPKVARGPKLIIAMSEPHSTITAGVRHAMVLVATGNVVMERAPAHSTNPLYGAAVVWSKCVREQGFHPSRAWHARPQALAKPKAVR